MQEGLHNSRSAIGLKWKTISEVNEVCENPETAALVMRYLAEEIVCSDPKHFPRKAFTAFFDGYLIGCIFPWHPKGYASRSLVGV